MVVTDGIHIAADRLAELHDFASRVGIKRCWFHGSERGHPHYDKPRRMPVEHLERHGAERVRSRECLLTAVACGHGW